MPAQTNKVRQLTGAATLVGALGLGAVLGIPGVGLAQTEDTTSSNT